jgi:hypothetical protein
LEKDVRLTFSQYDEVRLGLRSLACECGGGEARIEFSPGNIGFVMKDGESGGWASKATKENGYRAKRRETMAQRERDHVFKNSLIPNYAGNDTGDWREAQELARKERGEAAAATYEPLVSGGST